MTQTLMDAIRDLLSTMQGLEVSISDIRKELHIDPKDKSWDGVRVALLRLSSDKVVRPSGKKNGVYIVVRQVKPIQVFGKPRRDPIRINFPKYSSVEDFYEMDFAEDLIIREGDLILISGLSNQGKTALCLNFCAENIDSHPILMGNEYTTIDNEPSSRFMNRLDAMDWVEWTNGTGEDKFVLLPVRSDYAEHIVKDRINIIDWINIETGEHYMISKIMEDIKRELGKGIAIISIQKAEGTDAGRGGQFTKDFADVELLLDKLDDREVLLKIGKVKESKKRVSGRTFAYTIFKGVKITNFREVVQCSKCHGKRYNMGKPCDECSAVGYIEK